MAIERVNRPVPSESLERVARSLLDASNLCAIATVGRGGGAHVNTAYFAWSGDFRLVWLSEPRAQHSRNLRANRSAAVAVFDSRQKWGRPDRGIQLFGDAEGAEDAEDAAALYANRFPSFRAADFGAYRLFVFRPRRLKLFDEEALGPATFVTAKVTRGSLAWQRTERYR